VRKKERIGVFHPGRHTGERYHTRPHETDFSLERNVFEFIKRQRSTSCKSRTSETAKRFKERTCRAQMQKSLARRQLPARVRILGWIDTQGRRLGKDGHGDPSASMALRGPLLSEDQQGSSMATKNSGSKESPQSLNGGSRQRAHGSVLQGILVHEPIGLKWGSPQSHIRIQQKKFFRGSTLTADQYCSGPARPQSGLPPIRASPTEDGTRPSHNAVEIPRLCRPDSLTQQGSLLGAGARQSGPSVCPGCGRSVVNVVRSRLLIPINSNPI